MIKKRKKTIKNYHSLKTYLPKAQKTNINKKVIEKFEKQFENEIIDMEEIQYQRDLSSLMYKFVGAEGDFD